MAAAGTLILTNNSTTVNGSGTSFTTGVSVGGFLVASVGGTVFTLGIKSIESNTSLTLQVAYNGPSTNGIVFDYVPMATLNLITSGLAAQLAYAVRGFNLDKNNWQQLFTANGNITVTLPDGTTSIGPSWKSLVTSLDGKFDKTGGSVSGAISFASRAIAGQTAINLGIAGSSRAAVAPISQTQSVRIVCDTASPVPSQGTATITFATAFASAPNGVVVSNGNAQVASTLFIGVTFIGAGGFQVFITNRDGTPVTSQVQLNYTAIGVVNS